MKIGDACSPLYDKTSSAAQGFFSGTTFFSVHTSSVSNIVDGQNVVQQNYDDYTQIYISNDNTKHRPFSGTNMHGSHTAAHSLLVLKPPSVML